MNYSKIGPLRNALALSHQIAQARVRPGDTVIDATCGRGLDTVLLAGLVGEAGKVYAFDIQEEAVQSTAARLNGRNLQNRAVIIHDDHRRIAKYIDNSPTFCIFNLGYLPGGDHAITTGSETTSAALQGVLNLLAPEGTITLVCYTGHPGGREELLALRSFLAGISQQYIEVVEVSFVNQINNPAHLFVVYKLKGGSL